MSEQLAKWPLPSLADEYVPQPISNPGGLLQLDDTGVPSVVNPGRSLAVGPGITLDDDGSTVTLDTVASAGIARYSVSNFDPMLLTTTPASTVLTSGEIRFMYFRAPIAQPLTNNRYRVVTHAFTTPSAPTFCGTAIYQILPNGTHTLITSTPNDITAFGASASDDGKILGRANSASWTPVSGGLYALAFLFIGAGTGPAMARVSISSDTAFRYSAGTLLGEPYSSFLDSQSGFPSSVSPSTLTGSGTRLWTEVAT